MTALLFHPARILLLALASWVALAGLPARAADWLKAVQPAYVAKQ